MAKKRFIENRIIYMFVAALVVLLFLVGINISFGSVHIDFLKLCEILTGKSSDIIYFDTIWKIRIPRIIAVSFLGGALAVSGYLMQIFFANPIAGPYVLGISSGAKLAIGLTLIVLTNAELTVTSGSVMMAAFIGSLGVMSLVMIISRHVENASMLIVCGVMVGYICTAILDFIMPFTNDSNIISIHNWSKGSFSGMSMNDAKAIALLSVTGFFISFMMSKKIGAYQMGENYARSLGVNIKIFRLTIVLLSSFLAGLVTSYAGPVSFVGVAVPHISIALFKKAKPIIMIPACYILGSIFCLTADFAARMLFSPVELNISSVTAIFGAPIVIYVMIKRRGR